MKEPVLQRVRKIIDYLAISDRKFSELIGIPQTTLSSLFQRGSDPNIAIVQSIILAIPYISTEWLIFGSGDMIKQEPLMPSVGYSSGRPYYNVDFIGGFDLILNNQTVNPEYNIDFAPYNKDGVLWCNITGHSMSPEISSGDMMAIREVSDWGKFLTMNETYAIVTRNDLRTVKKLRKGSDNDHFLLVPVNKEYDEQEIAKEMILKVYSVLGCMKRF